jgi:hypothetical protein
LVASEKQQVAHATNRRLHRAQLSSSRKAFRGTLAAAEAGPAGTGRSRGPVTQFVVFSTGEPTSIPIADRESFDGFFEGVPRCSGVPGESLAATAEREQESKSRGPLVCSRTSPRGGREGDAPEAAGDLRKTLREAIFASVDSRHEGDDAVEGSAALGTMRIGSVLGGVRCAAMLRCSG